MIFLFIFWLEESDDDSSHGSGTNGRNKNSNDDSVASLEKCLQDLDLDDIGKDEYNELMDERFRT